MDQVQCGEAIAVLESEWSLGLSWGASASSLQIGDEIIHSLRQIAGDVTAIAGCCVIGYSLCEEEVKHVTQDGEARCVIEEGCGVDAMH